MADIAELDTAPDTIEASLIYLADTGEKLVTQVADPGGRDQRQGGDSETHRVKIRNGRPLAGRFASRAPPIAMSPALNISACSRLVMMRAPMSSRLRPAITGATAFSGLLMSVPTPIAT